MRKLILSTATILLLTLAQNASAQAKAQNATSGNPIFPGWYADPEAAIFDNADAAAKLAAKHGAQVTDVKTALDRVTKFVAAVPKVGRSEMEVIGDLSLSVIDPNQYRGQIIDMIFIIVGDRTIPADKKCPGLQERMRAASPWRRCNGNRPFNITIFDVEHGGCALIEADTGTRMLPLAGQCPHLAKGDIRALNSGAGFDPNPPPTVHRNIRDQERRVIAQQRHDRQRHGDQRQPEQQPRDRQQRDALHDRGLRE